jgi:hypothetical protein
MIISIIIVLRSPQLSKYHPQSLLPLPEFEDMDLPAASTPDTKSDRLSA